MKILFLASYFPKPGNPIMGTWALTQAQALVRQGIKLEIVSFTSWVPQPIALTPGAKAYADCPQCYTWPGDITAYYPRWLYYPVTPFKQWAYINPNPYLQMAWHSAKQKLIQTIKCYQPDLIFCHHSLPNAWIVTQLPVPYQRPLVVLDHDFDEISDGWHYPKRKAAMQLVAHKADAWLAVSNRMTKDLARLFPFANTKTHHNGVDLPPPSLAQQPRPVEIQAKVVVLTCALFAERKGIPLLVRAFSNTLKKHPEAILRIVGSEPEESRIRQTIYQLGIEKNVQMVGRLPHTQVLQEIAWADCFALTGWDEPFATVFLEAMAAGKPIICCSDGGITDVIQNEVHGLVVAPKDINGTTKAIDHMLSSKVSRQQWGRNARLLISSSLTWDTKASELIFLFETILRNEPESLHKCAVKTA